MLEPQDRRLLLEALRPPEGYRLDAAVGTTYSLDLLAMLTTPLAFSLFDLQDTEGRPTRDPVALLEALRRHVDRISVFCQGGAIAVPRTSKLLFGYLEESVHQVLVPGDAGVFHPKTWLVRYSADEGPVRYRFLCGTRNLTYDRSWDSLLVLDGELMERKNAYSANQPLGEFIESLPGLSVHPLAPTRAAEIERMAYEVRRVAFELPDGFDELRFWPLGIGRGGDPFAGRIDRLLVMSPFLASGFFQHMEGRGDGNVLISRLESLMRIPGEDLADFEDVYVFNNDAEEDGDSDAAPDSPEPLSGLHGKLYIADAGWNARVWTGSANATAAALHQNVEFLVELQGKKRLCGIDALLDRVDGNVNFMDFLVPYEAPEEPAPDEDDEELGASVEMAQRAVARMGWFAEALEEDSHFRLRIGATEAAAPELENVHIRCWPISLAPDAHARTPDLTVAPGIVVDFGEVSFEALTSFFAFEVSVTSPTGEAARRFVMNADLQGAPRDRRERLLYAMLENEAEVLRYLLILLADDPLELITQVDGDAGGEMEGLLGGALGRAMADGLMERLLRALARDPEKLDQVARLVRDLRANSKGRQLLPDGFDAIWEAVEIVHAERAKWTLA